MFSVYKNGDLIGLIEQPKYVREHNIGCYEFCDYEKAQGILFNNKIYNISELKPILGKEMVTLLKTDSGEIIHENNMLNTARISVLQSENSLLRQQVAALSDQNDFQEELIVELANIVYA